MLFRKCFTGLIRRSMSSQKLVTVSVDDKNGIATVNLTRPPVNSLNLELLTELSAAFTQLENAKTRGLIMKSANEGVFSAGIDILELYKPDQERVRAFWSTLQEVWIKLYGFKAPTVACINGHAPAGGCLLALCCEYRVMLKEKTIGLNETKLGIIAPSWFRESMENVIGVRQTEVSLTAGLMHSTENALKLGLIDEIAENTEDAVQKSHKFLELFKHIPAEARSKTKLDVRRKTIENLAKTREADLELFCSSVNEENAQRNLERYLNNLKGRKSQ